MFGIKHSLREEEGGDAGNAGGGGAAPNWRDMLSEDFRSHPGLEKFTEIDSLAKSYLNAEQMIPKDKMVIPTTDEEFAIAYGKLGRPDEPTGYKFVVPEGMTEANMNKDQQTEFASLAHEIGLNQNQLDKLNNWYWKTKSSAESSHEDFLKGKHNEAVEKLEKEWGNDYERRAKVAHNAIEELGDDDLKTFLEDTGLGDHPSLVKLMYNVGQSMMEDGKPDTGGQGQAEMTPDQIKEQISELMSNPAYLDSRNPSHESVVNKVQGLYRKLHM